MTFELGEPPWDDVEAAAELACDYKQIEPPGASMPELSGFWSSFWRSVKDWKAAQARAAELRPDLFGG